MRLFLLLFVILIATLLLTAQANAHHTESFQIKCIAKVIYHEARGEPVIGQIAVGHVVMNRVESSDFPNTPCKVVNQPRQFTDFYKRTYFGGFKSDAWQTALLSAQSVYYDKVRDPTKGAVFYLNPRIVRKKVLTSWKRKYRVIVEIHNHKFFGVK